ncbi:hypothetical protein F5Y18DRAFT_64008 [Xylariaceae sp. FL1019]|nr:hypothetical protein F5Y18DRAFT_64008 [Xylariaceae sp. FL1019]
MSTRAYWKMLLGSLIQHGLLQCEWVSDQSPVPCRKSAAKVFSANDVTSLIQLGHARFGNVVVEHAAHAASSAKCHDRRQGPSRGPSRNRPSQISAVTRKAVKGGSILLPLSHSTDRLKRAKPYILRLLSFMCRCCEF